MRGADSRRSAAVLVLGIVAVLGSVAARALGSPPPASGVASLSGVVVDEAGTPIGGADVAAYDACALLRRLAGGGALEDPSPLDAAARGTADAKGRFTLGGLSSATYTVVASAPGHGVGYLEDFPAAQGGAPTLVVTLGPGVVVEGDVVDGAGKGIPSMPVAAGVGFEREVPWTRSVFARAFGVTDAAGHFRVEGVPTRHGAGPIGSYSVCAGGPDGWRCHRFLLDGVPHVPVRIRFGGVTSLAGTVRDGDGGAVAGARVVATFRLSADAMWASGEPAGWMSYAVVATSGADGTYRIADVPTGASSSVEVHAGARGVGASPGGDGESRETTKDVSLLPSVRLTGALTALDGQPAANAEVFALDDAGLIWTTRGDAVGRWTIPGLMRRPVHLIVVAPGALVPEALRSVKVASDAREVSHDVRLVAAAHVAGRVLDERGAPVVGAVVRASSAEGRGRGSVKTCSGIDGAFLALGLGAGDLILSAEAQGGRGVAETRVTLAAGQGLSRVDLRFPISFPDPAKALDAGAKPESVAADLRVLVEAVRAERQDARLAAAVRRLRAVGPRCAYIVPELATLLRDPPPAGFQAAYVLSAMGDAGAMALATSLAGDIVSTHEAAAQMLADMGATPTAVRSVLLRRLRDGTPLVRAFCARALGHGTRSDSESIAALTSALADADDHVVHEALGAIARLAPSDPRVAAALRPLLAKPDVRLSALLAAKALGAGAEPLVGDLLGALRIERDVRIRQSLAEVLGSIGTPAIPAIVAFLHEGGGDETSRRHVLQALSIMRTDALDALLELAKDPDAGLRAGAIRAIRGAGPRLERTVAALVATLNDADADVRAAAVEGLGYLGSNAVAALPALRARLEKGGDDARATRAVIGTLGAMGPGAKAAVPELLTALSGPMRSAAADALGRMGDVAAVAQLASALGEDVGLEERVTDAIARFRKDPQSAGVREAARVLMQEGAPAKLETRFVVAVALLRLDVASKEARAVLLAHLVDTQSSDRSRAIARLAEAGRGGRDLADRLDAIAANDPEDAVRAAACGALASFGATDMAIERLRPLLASDHSGVAWEAVEALRRLGPAGAPLAPHVLRLIDDERRFSDRRLWVGALGALGPAGDVVEAPLTAFLTDAAPLHRDSRESAAVALLELGRRIDVALPIVAESLDEMLYPFLPRAIAALGDLGPKASPAASALERLTDHRDPAIREAAYAALRRLKK